MGGNHRWGCGGRFEVMQRHGGWVSRWASGTGSGVLWQGKTVCEAWLEAGSGGRCSRQGSSRDLSTGSFGEG